MKDDFRARVDRLRDAAKELNDPVVDELLDAVLARVTPQGQKPGDMREVGDHILKALKGMGLPQEPRDEVRQILADYSIAGVACW